MDVQTELVYIAVVVISAAVIVLVSMFGIQEKSYEEAIAEQRKFPDDLLLNKKDKSKEKKHKNKAGKKIKEKKKEKEEKEDKEEKPDHVQFEENPQILPLEPLLRERNKRESDTTRLNAFTAEKRDIKCYGCGKYGHMARNCTNTCRGGNNGGNNGRAQWQGGAYQPQQNRGRGGRGFGQRG
uniref:uncharacterized protein LOC117162220 n=1 Tax=Bombus vancouverensis nearcticus TaxID=2705178 RepID=UPI0014395C04|nr:uncharacterized protein LOC117162220 [Bombus vancouverensis nearcticus]